MEEILKVKLPSKEEVLESYKTLRTNLLYIKDLKVISITSASPNEGKTVTAFNLARSLALLGDRVLLVDCDLRRSSLQNFLSINKEIYGVSEILTNQMEGKIHATDVENFFVLLSGKKPPNPSEILSGQVFDKLLGILKEKFDYVIIDTPPISVATDAAIIGRLVDGVVLVARNDFTQKKIIKRAKIDLERNGSRIVGVVLNRVKKNQVDYGHYGYGKYYY